MSTAAIIAKALKGKPAGKGWIACCPAHDDSSPSFSIGEIDGRVLVKCHTGCRQDDVLAALTRRGLWGSPRPDAARQPLPPAGPKPIDQRDGYKAAMALWKASAPGHGTIVEAYLKSRAIKIRVSDELRFLPCVQHRESGMAFPVMLARISDGAGFCAVQRTFLRKDGSGKADVKPAKKGLGAQGVGAVRLKSAIGDVLGLAEGIETALSASQMYAMPVWAVLSAARLSAIEIPRSVKFLHIFGDPGEAGQTQAFRAADDYEAKGFHVETYFPQAHFNAGSKADFNDVITSGAARAHE